MVRLMNRDPVKGKAGKLELRKSGEEAGTLASEGRFQMYGSLSHCVIYQSAMAEKALNTR